MPGFHLGIFFFFFGGGGGGGGGRELWWVPPPGCSVEPNLEFFTHFDREFRPKPVLFLGGSWGVRRFSGRKGDPPLDKTMRTMKP